MKILGALLICAAAVSAAIARRAEQRCRIKRLRDFASFFSLMRGELGAYAMPLPELLNSLIPRLSGQARHFAQTLLRELPQLAEEGFSAIWERSVSADLPELGETERRVLDAVGQTLGRREIPGVTDHVLRRAAGGADLAAQGLEGLLAPGGDHHLCALRRQQQQALMTTITALVVVLMVVVQKISELFNMIKTLFHL